LKLLIRATGSAFAPPWYVIAALAIGMLALTQLQDTHPRESRTTPGERPAGSRSRID
jgi:hypothetical protein